MALTMVTTAGGATANSYASVAEFADFMNGRTNFSAYTDATPDERKRALVEAARWLTDLPWDGLRVDATQALAWPRQLARDPDSPTATYFGTTTVPQRVKDAQCELAFQILKAGTTDITAHDANLNVQTEVIGPISTTYFPARDRPRGLGAYPSVVRKLQGLLGGSRAHSASFHRLRA